jgi:uncharacterized short protein YbdD (DUF466 family)
MRERLQRIYNHLRGVMRWWAGDDEYGRYLERTAALHQPPMDRGRYFAERLEERYRSASRCC